MDKKIWIIDRTILEIVKKNKVDNMKLSCFAERLLQVGADILELDARSLGVIKKKNTKFIYRISRHEDLMELKEKKPIAIIVNYNDIFNIIKEHIKFNLILELEAKTLKVLCSNKKIENLIDVLKPSVIRIIGIYDLNLYEYFKYIQHLRTHYGVKVDICSSNKSKMATAVALEAFDNGVDYLTASFCGYGSNGGGAALEEIIMAIKLLYKVNIKCKTWMLNIMTKEFCELTGKNIHNQKPILGRDIFKCESGVHIHGILRDSSTYEPYPPQMVGKNREFVIGKHSGKKIYRNADMKVHFVIV